MIESKFYSDMFERPYAIRIMLHLRKNFPTPLVDLQYQIKANRSALERRIDELSEAGLVKIEKIKNAKHRVIVSLTPSGRNVANQLLLIDGLGRESDN